MFSLDIIKIFNLVLFMWSKYASSFNLDVQFPIVYEDPEKLQFNRSTYFGFSVILQSASGPKTRPWIQIGAPRGSSRIHRNIHQPGVVYRCPIVGVCGNPLVLDTTGNEEGPRGVGEVYWDRKDDAWIGGAMDVQSHEEGGRVAVCGHRWINQKYIQKSLGRNDYLMTGVCYWLPPEDQPPYEIGTKLLPLLNSVKEYHFYKPRAALFDYGVGQCGISVHFPVLHNATYTSHKPQLLIGAPGIYNWKGSSALYKEFTEFSGGGSNRKRAAELNVFGNHIVPDPHYFDHIEYHDYFGYQVTSGYFFGKEELLYVGSAPRASNCTGKVLLYSISSKSEDPPLVNDTKLGSMMGEYFGASLAVTDINRDGFDDLVIGAPLYTEDIDEGCIYVFLGSPVQTSLVTPVIGATIVGQFPRAHFGSAIAAVGDLDKDSFNDIIVGAPYEDNYRGAVYIYRGSAEGLDVQYSQRIQAKNVFDSLRGFGISISRGADIDNNQYKDVAIGAYLSGHTILFRSHPVVTLGLAINSNVLQLRSNKTVFDLNVCLWYNGTDVPSTVTVARTIVIDAQYMRAHIVKHISNSSLHVDDIILYAHKETCNSFKLQTKAAPENLIDPVTIAVTSELKNCSSHSNVILIQNTTERDQFKMNCPLTHRSLSTNKKILTIPFAVGCGDDNICSSNLELTTIFPKLRRENIYLIGSSRSQEMVISVTNTGEPAYFTVVEVSIPKPAYLSKTPLKCEESKNITASNASLIVICLMGNPVQSGVKSELVLEIDMKEVAINTPDLEFHIRATTKSKDTNPSDKVLRLKVKVETQVDITLARTPGGIHLFDKMNSSVENITFFHSYEVQKFGTTPVDEVEIQLQVPTVWRESGSAGVELVLYTHKDVERPELRCNYDQKYKLEITKASNNISIDTNVVDISTVEEDTSVVPSRKRRLADSDTISATLANIPANRTLFLNCSTPTVHCTPITCTAGPFHGTQTVVRLLFTILLKLKQMERLLGKKDVISFSSEGYVKIIKPTNLEEHPNTGPNSAIVVTNFVGNVLQEEVATWIIALAIAIGILLLLLLITGLIKLGFFERRKKKELELLKAADATDEFTIHKNETTPEDDGIECEELEDQ